MACKPGDLCPNCPFRQYQWFLNVYSINLVKAIVWKCNRWIQVPSAIVAVHRTDSLTDWQTHLMPEFSAKFALGSVVKLWFCCSLTSTLAFEASQIIYISLNLRCWFVFGMPFTTKLRALDYPHWNTFDLNSTNVLASSFHLLTITTCRPSWCFFTGDLVGSNKDSLLQRRWANSSQEFFSKVDAPFSESMECWLVFVSHFLTLW